MRLLRFGLVLIVSFGAACTSSVSQPGEATSPEIDPLFAPFLEDGKFDALGHPVGARVFEAEAHCRGANPKETQLHLQASGDEGVVVCDVTTDMLGRGRHVANLRAAAFDCPAEGCEELFSLVVTDAAGTVLAESAVEVNDASEHGALQNLSLDFRVQRPGPVSVQVTWAGERDAAIDYIEVFRRDPQLVLSPPSSVLSSSSVFEMELVEPEGEVNVEILCNGEDISERFATLQAEGVVEEEVGEFRRILRVQASELFEGCENPRHVIVKVPEERWGYWGTSEALYLDEAPPCDYEGADGPKVLVSGFMPFPAAATFENSSRVAVLSARPEAMGEVSLMSLVLPVEYDAAADLVADVAARCGAEVIVGFGQGRNTVDVETTAYNTNDTSEVAGGVPDNRGLVRDGAPIDGDGPASLPTDLPAGTIVEALEAAGVRAKLSDDPGRYVCNDLFYRTAHRFPGQTVGFVHLPTRHSPTDAVVMSLAEVVETVVRETVAHAGEQ